MLPQTLGGCDVEVGDRLLPLVFASSRRSMRYCRRSAGGTKILSVEPRDSRTCASCFTVKRNAPGLSERCSTEDGSEVSSDAPARTGELLTVYTARDLVQRTTRGWKVFPIPASPEYLIADGWRYGWETRQRRWRRRSRAGAGRIDAVRFRLSEGTGSGALKVVVKRVESNVVTVAVR